jgi:hypothetical protein
MLGVRSVVVSVGVAALLVPGLWAQEAPGVSDGPMIVSPRSKPAPAEDTPAPVERKDAVQAAPPMETVPFDKAMFQPLIPPGELSFLSQFDGAPSNELYRDKQFRHLLKSIVPGWMFHYGRDMSLPDALDAVMQGSSTPVEVREGRYVLLSGSMGAYLGGRGFVWVDMQDGIGLGGFFFRPTNGEPTPTLTVFSRQVREDALELSQLPPAFAEDMRRWQAESRVPLLTTRYFIGDVRERVLLEHDEDFCSYLPGVHGPPPDECEQMNADAADSDMNTAYYLEQVHYATNATAWMIVGADETAFIELRDSRCRRGPDPLACRIRMTRKQVRVVAPRGRRK